MAGLLLTNVGELVTNAPGAPDVVGAVPGAAVAARGRRVAWAGPQRELPAEQRDLPVLDCEGRAVVPGFVDAHTHLVFAGERSGEFAQRLAGASYEEITNAGGGIHATVAATRAAEFDDLVVAAAGRVRRLLAAGTTTVEVKSGYGLDVTSEQEMLRVIDAVAARVDADLVPTFLGAHVMPSGGDRARYVDLVVGEMLAACAPLARYCDVFCDGPAFTVEEARRILAAAARRGLGARLHAEQLGHGGGAALAAEVGAVSADHLDHATPADAAALAAAGTVAVLLPAASYALRAAQAPARLLWDAGVTVALATDLNPGTSYTEGMGMVISLACVMMGLTPAEAVWAATRGGALAVEEPDKGWVGEGARADLVVLDAPSHVHLAYRPAANLAWAVLKDGRVVAGGPAA